MRNQFAHQSFKYFCKSGMGFFGSAWWEIDTRVVGGIFISGYDTCSWQVWRRGIISYYVVGKSKVRRGSNAAGIVGGFFILGDREENV